MINSWKTTFVCGKIRITEYSDMGTENYRFQFSDFLKVYLLTGLRTSGQAARWERNMQKWEAIQRRRQP